MLLFGILTISLKAVAHSAHAICKIARARCGKTAHLPFLFFGFCSSVTIASMLLLGGAATVEILAGMNYASASFLIPWGIILHTTVGGLKAIYMASYLHTMMIIFAVVTCMITIMYIKVYSSDMIYQYLHQTVSNTEEQCTIIFSKVGAGPNSFYCNAGAVLILIVLFMTIVSTGSAESIAVLSLVAYDIYLECINPNATGKQMLFVSRLVIVVFNVVMGFLVVSRSV